MKHVIRKSFLPKEGVGMPTQGTLEFFCKNCGTELCWEFEYAYTARRFDLKNKLSSCEYDMKSASSWGDEKRVREIKKDIKYLKNELKRCDVIEASEYQARIAYEKISDQPVCPICGDLLSKERGYFMPGLGLDREAVSWIAKHYNDIRKGCFVKREELVKIRQGYDKTQASKLADCFARNCEMPCEAFSIAVDDIKSDPNALKTYLLHQIQLENNIYSLKCQLADLYYRRLTNDRNVVYGKEAPAYLINEEIDRLKEQYNESKKQVAIAEKHQPKISIKKPQKPQAPILEKPGFFNKKRVLAENEVLMSQYEKAMTAYQNDLQQYEEKKARMIESERKEVLDKALKQSEKAKAVYEEAKNGRKERIESAQAKPIPANAIAEVLNLEITKTEELLKNTIDARNELYAYNIIFIKYRDVVALSSFYEYLMAGRCSSLEGADGAYNLYENEIRMNRVIDQLDTVILSLDEIKQNQYLIYHELCNISSSLESLSSSMDKALISIQGIEVKTTSINEHVERISKNSDVIAHNTAVTAYYSKINAELTNALGYMLAFK